MSHLEPTPSAPGIVCRLGQFDTLVAGLEYAATGACGMNFYSGRGELTEVMTYADLAVSARKNAGLLLGHGLKPGDRVGLVAETEGDFVRAFAACLLARLVPCPMPLPAAFGPVGVYGQHIERIARVSQLSAVVTNVDYLDWVREPLERTGLDLRFIGPLSALDQSAEAPLPDAPNANDLAYLQFSSGTTSAPKGIAISHSALIANVRGIGTDKLGIGGLDRGVNWLPLYHDMGLVGCMLLPISSQMSVDYLTTRSFIRQPATWLKMISRARATLSYAPSFGYNLAARRPGSLEGLDLSSWRVAGIGGDMIKAQNLQHFAETFAPAGFSASSFVASYGMAEVSLGLTFTGLEQGCRTHRLDVEQLEKGLAVPVEDGEGRSFAVCGTPLPDHYIELRDDDGNVVPDGQVGTVFGRGPSMMQGYFLDPEATKEVLDQDGWLNTGDLGCIIDGELVLTGRAKDLIIVNGRNIWPQDIEWTVEHHLTNAREGSVAAFGAAGSESAEEEVTVVIECRAAEEDREAFRAEAAALVRQTHGISPRVALSKPGLLPRTSSGKLSRAEAKAMYFGGKFNL
jgi:fatty-acyl-CoA synthase